MRAIVIFTDSDWWPLRWLRPGYRHCAVGFVVDGRFVLIDYLSHWCRVDEVGLRDCGRAPARLVAVDVAGSAPAHRALTCVGVVKRLLGIRAWWVQTPRQLSRYLDARA